MEKSDKLIKSSVYTTETDLSAVKIVKNSLYGTFGIHSNTTKGPTNKPIFIDVSRKPKITWSFNKSNKNVKCKIKLLHFFLLKTNF